MSLVSEISDLATRIGAEIKDVYTALSGKVGTGDSRLTDTRTPTDASVTNAKVHSSAAIALSKLAAGYAQCSKNGTVQTVTLWFGTEAQYNTATSSGASEDANTVYFRA